MGDDIKLYINNLKEGQLNDLNKQFNNVNPSDMRLDFICKRVFKGDAKNIDITLKQEILVEKVDISKKLIPELYEKCNSKL
jgi:hypothetical protein